MEALTSIKHAVAASPTETAVVVSVVAVLLGIYFTLTRCAQDLQQQVSHQSGWALSLQHLQEQNMITPSESDTSRLNHG
jgi:hypothetical protein